MPELPEDETTKRGITPYILNQTISALIVRQSKLRLPVTEHIHQLCQGQNILDVKRRGKYLLLTLRDGTLLIHLGMSGCLRIEHQYTPARKHEHISMHLNNETSLRYSDPRRFGLWLYLTENPFQHKLLQSLGPEPLSDDFNERYLYKKASGKKQCIKSFIMDSHVVAGIGNIYATESLFLSGIHPLTPAGALSKESCMTLTIVIKKILQNAISVGGTTLRDFYSSNGKPGYFSLSLLVYGRKGLPCLRCNSLLLSVPIACRQSVFCPTCQFFPHDIT